MQLGGITLKGRYRVQVTRGASDTAVYESDWFDNLITNNGLDLFGLGFSPTCWVGFGTTTPVETDAGLERSYGISAGMLSKTRIGANADDTPPYSRHIATFRFGIGQIHGPVSEVGIGPSDTSLFSRALLPIELLLDGDLDRLYVIYEFRQCVPTESQLFDVVINGVTHSCEAYPVSITGAQWQAELGERVWEVVNSASFRSKRYFYAWRVDAGGVDLKHSAGWRESYSSGSYECFIRDTRIGPGLPGSYYKLRVGSGFANTAGFHESHGGIWEILIDPPIEVEEHQRFVFDVGVTWARCAGDGTALPNPEPGEPEDPEEPTEPSLSLWLDAADVMTITESDGAVSQWADKSGNGWHAIQGDTAAQPTYAAAGLNGKGVVIFDGGSDFLQADLDFLAGVSHSAFIVTHPTTFSNIYGAANGNQAANSLHVGFNDGGDYKMNYWGNDFDPLRSANFVEESANIINYIWTTGVGKQILANGKSEGANTDAGDIGTMSGGGRIGRTTGHPFFGGDIAEIIILTVPVSVGDRQEIEGYLAHKWGLEANLPSDHPYKTTDPGVPDFFPVIDPSTWIEAVDAEFWPTQRLVLGVLSSEGDFTHIETWEDASDTVLPSDDVIAAVNAKTAETGLSAAYGTATAEGYTLTFSIADSTGFFDAEVTVAQHEEKEVLGEMKVVFTSRRYRLYRQ